ncbi:MAG: tRNA pseudouridine(55) synthase TruB [Lentisphaerae bacterium]|nr:tRNA pseudouridine(55) synthase TruB [Lentisphaerota bacterium]
MIRTFSAPPPVEYGPFDGLLLVDKPAGPTSHDVVHKIRRTFRIEKVGHGGTLDPAATGLLVILLGRATRLSDQIMGGEKTYAGVLRLGTVTNSQDLDGQIIAEQPFDAVTRDQAETALAALRGDIYQTPPMVSAIKLNGVPLYKLARKGQEVAREPRLVHIFRFAITAWVPPLVSFEVRCTKGTYVRTLAHDLGQALGCGACLHSLRRTASGSFDVAAAAPLDALLAGSKESLAARIIPYMQVGPVLASPR